MSGFGEPAGGFTWLFARAGVPQLLFKSNANGTREA